MGFAPRQSIGRKARHVVFAQERRFQMTRHTPETLCISAIINSGNAHLHMQYGISAAFFTGYRPEFEWLESFVSNNARLPSWDEFSVKWPDFPVSTEQDDAKWPAQEMMRQYTSQRTSRALLKAGIELRAGRVESAVETVRSLEIYQPVTKAPSLLRDYGYLDSWENQQPRIALPWDTLQGYTLGIGKGELWYLGARPSQGKSFILLNIAAHAAIQGHRVAMYSLEMTKEQTQQRLHTILANTLGIKVNLNDLRKRRITAGEYKEILQDLDSSVPGEIFIHTPAEGPVSPSVIGAGAGDYDLSIVDYIGLMRQDGGGRAVDEWRTIASISNQLKEIALAHNTRIVVASQVNREATGSKPPRLEHLAQSDALGQDADVVLTFRRPSVHTMRYSIEKNRHGEAGRSFWSHYDAAYGNFSEITRTEAEEIAYNDEEEGDY